MSVKKQFARYVSQNILGMIGISIYILADTFFISKAMGANGITALNLVLPVYNLIFAIGAMIGVGSAIRYVICRETKSSDANQYFSDALVWGLIIGVIFMVIGIFIPDKLVTLLGADAEILAVAVPYTRIFMAFAPCFIWNHIFNAFVRNDGAPSVAMMATLFSSLFNIVFDYILMFPCKMGMPGAALATAISPIIGILICLSHLKSEKSKVVFRFHMPSIGRLVESCQVGVSAFVGEISSGVITVAFNMIILRLAGNVGVAAYGVVANAALVAVALFNGIAQGSQPLISEHFSNGKRESVRMVMRLALGTSIVMSGFLLVMIYIGAESIANIFNSEQNAVLTVHAVKGLRIYFIGFVFAGINIVGTGILSAVGSAKWAFAASMLRGFVAILFFAFLLSVLFGMFGVWVAFPVAECITMIITLRGLKKSV